MGSSSPTDTKVQTRMRQQEVVAQLGQQALETSDLDELMHDASVAVAETLDNEYAKVLELMPGGEEVFLRQGVGWRDGLVGTALVPTDLDSQAGYTLLSEEPVIVEDLRTEDRFSGPELLTSHDVVSGISVIIGSVEEPWGVLGTHTTKRRDFTAHDATFVQSVANIIGAAIETADRDRELKRAFDLLNKTEQIADVGGWEIETDTMEVFWTDHIFELLEWPDDEEPPLEDALDVYHEDDRPIIEGAIEDAIDTGDPFDVEVRYWTGGGEAGWLRVQGTPELNDDDELVSLRGAVQDTTERKQHQQELEASNQRLEQFAYAASHDLQEPLRMVSSYLHLIEDHYDDVHDEEVQEYIAFALDGADRMRRMITGLLEYSRVDTEGDPLEPVNLEAVTDNVIDDLQLKIDETNAEITVESLPRVQGDSDQLYQVFQNLLDNAIEYNGDDPPQVHVSAVRTGSAWTVSVRDAGIGIDTKYADRIFDVFQRLHSRDEHPGTGIGLALCERIIERHGGEIWVDSEPNEGATFSFTLPAMSGHET